MPWGELNRLADRLQALQDWAGFRYCQRRGLFWIVEGRGARGEGEARAGRWWRASAPEEGREEAQP